MATKNPKINVTFEEKISGLLSYLAHQEHKSVASLVQELALEALEMREEFYLCKVAEKFDKDGVKTYDHDDAWK